MVLLGSLTLLLSTRVPFSNKISCFVSTYVSSDNSFPSVRQEPSFRPWKGSPVLHQNQSATLLLITAFFIQNFLCPGHGLIAFTTIQQIHCYCEAHFAGEETEACCCCCCSAAQSYPTLCDPHGLLHSSNSTHHLILCCTLLLLLSKLEIPREHFMQKWAQ